MFVDAKYNAAPLTLEDGMDVQVQADSHGSIKVVAVDSAGAAKADGYSYANITSATTTVVKEGGGIFAGISVNSPGTTNTVTIYDNTAGSGTVIATIAALADRNYDFFDVEFGTGLTIVTGASCNITVAFI